MKKLNINLGYKYQIKPTEEQKTLLNNQMFIYNQAYNICLNLQEQQWKLNKDLAKNERKYLKSTELDSKIKSALKERELNFKTVVIQQARINAEKALKSALTVKERGFPKFKNSKISKQSFNWNNQGYQILDFNDKFKILKLMKEKIKMRYHRDLPDESKINSITISKENNKYYVAFSISFEKTVPLISSQTLDISRAVGVDLNIHEIALSNGSLLDTDSKKLSLKKYNKKFNKLQRKQSRRILKSKKIKEKLGSNFRKTQNKLNKIYSKSKNQKLDKYNKITSELCSKFDLIVVEDLNTKNMTKRAKNTNIKQKSGLNKAILNTSFYQIISQISYKTMLNGKLFVKVPPQYTSKTCSACGTVNNNLRLSDRVFECECGFVEHRDLNASQNVLRLGLESFGLGVNLADYNCKAFRSTSVEVVS